MNSRYMMSVKLGLCQNFCLVVLLISMSGLFLSPPMEKLFLFMVDALLD